jgi:hypothetical protein
MGYKEPSPKDVKRLVLIGEDNPVIHLTHQANLRLPASLLPMIATGNYDSCSRTLSLKDIEMN